MPCCGSWYGPQGLLLACRLPAALSAAGHTPCSPPGSPPLACHRRLRDLLLRAGRRHLAVLVETWASLAQHSFFSSAARGWQMALCGAGAPFDSGRRARKSRWKSRAGAESTRLVVLVPKITVLRAWDTQGLFARMPPSHAPPSPSPTLPSPSPPPPSPSPTLPSLSPPASFPSPPPPSPSLPPPSPSRRHLATTIAIGIALAATAYATLSPWPSPSPPSPSPSPLPPLPSPLSPPPPLSPPSPLSRDAAPLSFDRASSRRFDWCAERRGFLLDFG